LNTVSTQKRKYELKARAEAQEETRQRIAGAAAELHEEFGVGHTTVADIARRAGVQRVTVYNHFADLEALLPACTAHWFARHPIPDLDAAFAEDDPRERVRVALAAFYPWYRENQAMQMRVQGERSTVPELERWMASTADVRMDALAEALAGGAPRDARTLIRLALDFWTWRRLNSEGLDDDAAARLMAELVPSAG
jgi:AcrR family transcriptional regulator